LGLGFACEAFFWVPVFPTLSLPPGCDTVTLPDPENVALAGAPKIAGCNDGGALHPSPLAHGGGRTGALAHGDPAEHACASYTSKAVSTSCEVSLAVVRKNTSPPPSLVSRNTDSSLEVPEETSDTQPPSLATYVGKAVVHPFGPPTPAGSYS
jgi:hypothetical protein